MYIRYMEYRFTIHLPPFGKQNMEPTGNGRLRLPNRSRDYMNEVAWIFKSQHPSCAPTKEAISVKIDAYYEIPASSSKKQKKRMLDLELHPTKKPDCDNIAKAICDSLNNLAYEDDKQITSLLVTKHYTLDIPHVDVHIKEIT